MAVLVRDGEVLGPCEVAGTRAARRRGLLGRDGVEGVLWLEPARAVHTVGMRFAIDVAHLDRHGTVLATATMPPGRLGRWVRRARVVIEAEAGTFARWDLRVGQRLGRRDVPPGEG